VWVPYPLQPAPGQAWVPWAWVALGLVGVAVQVYVTAGSGGRAVKAKRK
jgi:hypothetical protein